MSELPRATIGEAKTDPVQADTFRTIQGAARELSSKRMRERAPRGPDIAQLYFEDGMPYLVFDFEVEDERSRSPNALGSGQLYDEISDVEYGIWLPGEAGPIVWEYGGEILECTAFIHRLTAWPDDSIESWSRGYVCTREGRIFLIDGGMDWDWSGKFEIAITEIGESSSLELASELRVVNERR